VTVILLTGAVTHQLVDEVSASRSANLDSIESGIGGDVYRCRLRAALSARRGRVAFQEVESRMASRTFRNAISLAVSLSGHEAKPAIWAELTIDELTIE
jgi:hypothetical protein